MPAAIKLASILKRPMLELPLPDSAAAAHASRVHAAVRAAIEGSGGWIAFARYMQLVLYTPGLGYYAAGAAKLGAAGDFVTAPELTPLFAQALAVQVDAILAATGRREVLELGAGSGRLAADLLSALEARDALPDRYWILETSPDLRERQERTLLERCGAHRDRVAWLDALPTAIDGATLANEVLDAIPVHLVVRREGAIVERGVALAEDGLMWKDRPADETLALLADARLPPIEGYLSEVNPAAEALVETLGRRLEAGACLYIDYGFPASEYYHPQRGTGTLMCHYRHRAHTDPFLWPGLTDITAHVDFSAMAAAGGRAGLHVAGFAAQAPFLLGCGLLQALEAVGPPGSVAYIAASTAVQRLVSPAEMGELFKVLALARTQTIAWPGYTLADRQHRL